MKMDLSKNKDRSLQEQLLELIRCGLWGTSPNHSLFEGDVEWSNIMTLAMKQSVMGIISAPLEKLPSELNASRIQQIKLHKYVTLNRLTRHKHIKALKSIITLLQEEGIERPVLLKGLGISTNYLDPSLRQHGDIDIYIGSERYDHIHQVIHQSQYVVSHEGTDTHFAFILEGVTIEIHKQTTSARSIAIHAKEFTRWTKEMLEGDRLREEEIDGVTVYLPPYDYDAVYIFYHAWKHFITGGVGLRQLCDWCCYIDSNSDKIDMVELKKNISHYALDKPFNLFAAIAINKLGLKADRLPIYNAKLAVGYQKSLEKIWQGGNFGSHREVRVTQKSTILGRKLQSFKAALEDMCYVIRIAPYYAFRFYSKFIFYRIAINLHVLLHPSRKISESL